MFIKVIRKSEDKELLINVSHIWKIEVQYAVRLGRALAAGSLKDGENNPDALRIYTVFVGNEKIRLRGDSDDPVIKVIEKIYKNSIKGIPKLKFADPVD